MLDTLGTIATILGFVLYIFIEWPKIVQRWEQSYPVFEKFLIILSVISGIFGVVLCVSMLISFFTKTQDFTFYLFAFAATFGFSYLIDYWLENKTLAYRKTSSMRDIWLLMLFSVIIGVFGLSVYFLGS